jgi:hypothetical protein
MKLKMLGLAAMSAMVLMGTGGGTASATTLEVNGVAQNSSVSLSLSLKKETSLVLRDTSGFSVNTCTASTLGAGTDNFTGTTTTGGVWTLTFSSCTEFAAVHRGGTLHFAYIVGTNGTVTSSGAGITTGSPFGTLNCSTGSGTHLGTLTGSASGHATLSVNAVLSCGISTRWTGTYTVTSPTGLGVVA